MSSINEIENQMEAIAVSLYIKKYSALEKEIKSIYKEVVNIAENPNIYYYIGCVGVKNGIRIGIANEEIDFVLPKIEEIPSSFTETFTLNQLIRLDQKYSICNGRFSKIQLESFSKKLVTYDYFGSCIKFITMRNKLAHEYNELSFNEAKHVIEIVGIERLYKEFSTIFINFDLSKANDITIQILSNVVYISQLLKKIENLK